MIEEVIPSCYLDIIPTSTSKLTLGSPIKFEFYDDYFICDEILREVSIDVYDAKGKKVTWTAEICSFDSAETTWTPPLEWAEYNTTGNFITIKFKATVYERKKVDYGDGFLETLLDPIVSSETYEEKVYIPESTKPNVSITPGDHTDNRATFGAYISGKSKPYMDFAITTSYGATVTTLELKILNHSHYSSGYWLEQDTSNKDKYTGSYNFESNDGIIFANSTEVNFEIKVTDSRGFTTTYVLKEVSYPYSQPCISNLTVKRCNSSGTLNSSGSYLRVDFTATISPLGNKNSAVYTLRYKRKTYTSFSTISMTSYNGTYNLSGYKVFSATTSASYDVEMTATDSYCTTTKTAIGMSIAKLWSALKNGLGFAFGKIAEKANTLDMGFAIYMNNNKLHGLADPTDSDEAATKNYVDNSFAVISAQLAKIAEASGISLDE